MSDQEKQEAKKYSRREFVKVASAAMAATGLGGLTLNWRAEAQEATKKQLIPASEGYLLVDPKKCAGCVSCMLACSLVHHGRESLSLSRIQITQNPFERFPNDISQETCRQCVYPACVEACTTGALHVDVASGNIRTIDEDKCIGCQRCVEACPYEPARPVWNFEEKHAQKCDLCIDTPYWDETGGVGGQQACVAVCPMNAIEFTSEVPTQIGTVGYEKNMRGDSWKQLGLPTD